MKGIHRVLTGVVRRYLVGTILKLQSIRLDAKATNPTERSFDLTANLCRDLLV